MTDTARGRLLPFVRVPVLRHAVSERVCDAGTAEELSRHGNRPSPGTLYLPLHHRELDGLVKIAWQLRSFPVDHHVPRADNTR